MKNEECKCLLDEEETVYILKKLLMIDEPNDEMK